MRPTVRKHDDNIYLNYELPHRVHAAKVYPITASNGSSILVYGHNGGITFVWRGGKPFQKQVPEAKSSIPATGHAGGNNDDAIMIIDSDEDDEPREPAAQHVGDVFESEEEELDQSVPYSRIMDVFTYDDDMDVLQLAFPPLPKDEANWAAETVPPILRKQIVVAIACSDSSVRILSLPLDPMPGYESGASTGRTELGSVEVWKGTARDIPRGLALSWTLSSSGPASKQDRDIAMRNAYDESQSGDRSASKFSHIWSFIISWSSGHAHSRLHTAFTELHSEDLTLRNDRTTTVKTQNLPSPTCALASTSSWYPSPKHALLLVGDVNGVVRIYDPLGRANLHIGQAQQEQDRSYGTWLASFFVPFERKTSASGASPSVPIRTRILDAQWAFDGNCIIVLLSDGLWGIWDLEGIAPTPTTSKRLARDNARTISNVVSGAAVTPFSIRAYLAMDDVDSSRQDRPDSLRGSSGSNNTASYPSAKVLTPMTPNTRKTKQNTLFTSSTSSMTAHRSTIHAGLPRGGMSTHQTSPAEPGHLGVQSVTFFFSTSVYSIPNLMQYWQQALARDGLGTLVSPLDGVSTGGEMITCTALFPPPRHTATSDADILVAAEHRLAIVVPPKSTPFEGTLALRGLFAPAANSEDQSMTSEAGERLDSALLKRGELDLGGVERVLDGMNGESGRGARGLFGERTAGRRVGFAVDSSA